MKLTMAITLDGLVRAMRWKEHALTERLERGQAHRRDALATTGTTRNEAVPARENDDDRRSR